MISIVVCSRGCARSLEQNVKDSIGCDFEMIVIDNSNNEFSIFSAYNEGVRRSRGDNLCFMHEDIVFRSKGWGRKVEQMLEESSIGVLGVIGGKFVPQRASWWLANCGAGKIVQGSETRHGYVASVDGTDAKRPFEEVAVVDGLWFCMRREMFDEVRFDEDRFKGFHCYDVDICMQSCSVGKKVVVVPDILIEHKSRGDVNEGYYRDLRMFSEKWKDSIPFVRGIEMDGDEMDRLNKVVMAYQETVRKHDSLIRTHAYRLGNRILNPIKKLKKACQRNLAKI